MSSAASQGWLIWALLSALFAALTAIFAKIGVTDIGSDLATFLRTVIIVAVLGSILVATHQFQPLGSIGRRTWLFLTLSGLATGASWICYFRALKMGRCRAGRPYRQTQRGSGGRLCRGSSGRTPFTQKLDWCCVDRRRRGARRGALTGNPGAASQTSPGLRPAGNVRNRRQRHRAGSHG